MALRRKSFKLVGKVVFIILLLIIILGVYVYFFINPYRGAVNNLKTTLDISESITKQEALEDLDYVMKHIKERHPVYLLKYMDIIRALEQQYDKEVAALEDNCNVLDVWRASARIASRINDGHTMVFLAKRELTYISDFSQVKEYGLPTYINGILVEDLFSIFKDQYAYEIENHAKHVFYDSLICSREYLAFCGVDTKDGVTFTFQTENGEKDYHYSFVNLEDAAGYDVDNNQESNGWVYYNIDNDKNLGIFTLTTCNNNKEYKTTLNKFFHEVNENNITNVVVDLRGNGGGNSSVADEFLTYIDVEKYNRWDCDIRLGWLLWRKRPGMMTNRRKNNPFGGNLYVLTDVNTYSSAMDFAMLIKDNNIGELIGETSGNMPNSYGDIVYFQLPNTKLGLIVSFKKWYRVDMTKNEEPLTPDYEVDSQRAMEKVYELISK